MEDPYARNVPPAADVTEHGDNSWLSERRRSVTDDAIVSPAKRLVRFEKDESGSGTGKGYIIERPVSSPDGYSRNGNGYIIERPVGGPDGYSRARKPKTASLMIGSNINNSVISDARFPRRTTSLSPEIRPVWHITNSAAHTPLASPLAHSAVISPFNLSPRENGPGIEMLLPESVSESTSEAVVPNISLLDAQQASPSSHRQTRVLDSIDYVLAALENRVSTLFRNTASNGPNTVKPDSSQILSKSLPAPPSRPARPTIQTSFSPRSERSAQTARPSSPLTSSQFSLFFFKSTSSKVPSKTDANESNSSELFSPRIPTSPIKPPPTISRKQMSPITSHVNVISAANHASRFPMRTSSLLHNSAHAGMDAESMMNIPRRNINKRLQQPIGLKRYTLATADFYNADFSSSAELVIDASTSVESTGTDTESQSGTIGESLLDDDGEKVISHGSVFISALNDVSRVRFTAEDSAADTTAGGQEGSGGVEIAEKSRLDGRVDPRMQHGLPEVDYSEVFPRILGHRPGLEIFRMEAFKPVPVSDESFGTFCVGDCYVVLWSREVSREDEGKDLSDLAAIIGLDDPRSHRIIESRMLNRGKKRRRSGRGSYRSSPIPLSRPASSLGGDLLSASVSADSESAASPADAQPGKGTQSKRSSVRWSLVMPDDGSTLAADSDRMIPRRPASRQSIHINKRSSRSSMSSSKAPSDEDLSLDTRSYHDDTSDFDDGFDDDAYSYMDDDSNLSHHIYTWIGSAAELDKRFCSAMYAVALRNLLGSSARIQRETQEDESAEFKALFGGSVSHEEDTSRAAESALFVATPQPDEANDQQPDSESYTRVRKRPLRLYRVLQNRRGARDVVLRLVEPVASSLSSDTVYILDTGVRDIIQWNGSAAGLNIRSKVRMLVGRVNGVSSSAKTSGRTLEHDEGNEPYRFWDLLQGQRPQIVEPSEDDIFWDLAQQPATLYRVTSNLDPEPQSHAIAVETDGGPASRATSPSWDRQPNRSISPGTDGERSTPDQLLPDGLALGLKRALLDSRYCYVLDAGVEMFLWIGKDSTVSLRENVTELLARLVAIGSRPKWIGLHKCVEGVEPDVFKLRFPDWDASRVARVNWMAILNGEQSEDEHDGGTGRKKATTASKMRVDVRALYAPAPKLSGISESQDETSRSLQQATARLVNMSCFVYTKSRGGRFVTLPNGEKGHFFDQDAYLFLCAYRVATNEADTSRLRPETPGRSLLSPLPSSRRSSWRNSGRFSTIRRFSQNSSSDIRDRATPVQSSSPRTSVIVFSATESGESMKIPAELAPLHPSIPPPPALPPPPLVTTGVRRDNDQPLETPLSTARSDYSPIKLPDVECVVYFWPGQRASKLAYSTFKLKMQAEMEALVKELYHCSVRVELLEPGREPLQLLAHFDNKLVIHRGKSDEASALFSPSRDDRSSDRKATPSGQRMYHIRTDLRHRSTRAIEVTAAASSLVMRDCFFVHGPSYNGFDGILQSSIAVPDPEMLAGAAFLWTGRGASKEEIRLAHSISERIAERRQRQWKRQMEETGVVELNAQDDMDDPSRVFERAYLSIDEGSEPRGFWDILGITKLTSTPTARETSAIPVPVYGRGAEYHFRPIPRMLRCSCASGYFLVEEIVHYQQRDLQSDSCVILDPGAPLRAYVWVGREASDVVLKLTRKTVEVWFERLNDGRVVLDSFTSISALTSPKRTGIAPINDSRTLVIRPSVVTSSASNELTSENTLEESMAQARAAALKAVSGSLKIAQARSAAFSFDEQLGNRKREDDARESDVMWVVHGREPIEFRAFFHGWDEELMIGDSGVAGRSPVVVVGAGARGSVTAAISGAGTGST